MISEDMKLILEGLKDKLTINQYQLELECMNQAFVYEEIGELTSSYKADAKRAKEHLEYVKASLKADIRKEPDKFSLSKVTDSALDSTVILQEEYKVASTAAIDASELADRLNVLLESAAQRKAMLRDLVSLYTHNYYTNQDLSGEIKAASGVTEEQIVQTRIQNAARRKELQEEKNEEQRNE